MRRLIPQFVARFFCGRRGHVRHNFNAQAGVDLAKITGIAMLTIETCSCGESQVVKAAPNIQFPRRRG